MSSIANSRLQRLAVVAALMAALGVSGCGRKGPLDPPAAGVVAVPLTEDGQHLPSSGPETNAAAKKAGSSPKTLPILDWLVD